MRAKRDQIGSATAGKTNQRLAGIPLHDPQRHASERKIGSCQKRAYLLAGLTSSCATIAVDLLLRSSRSQHRLPA